MTQTTDFVPIQEFYDMAKPIVDQIHKRKDQPAYAADISLIAKALNVAYEQGYIAGEGSNDD